MKSALNKISGLILYTFLILFPFCFNDISSSWIIFFIAVIPVLIIFRISLGKDYKIIKRNMIFYPVIMLIIFSFIEKLNIIQMFSFPLEIKFRIPLSTILLVFGAIVLLIRAFLEGKIILYDLKIFYHFLLYAAALLLISAVVLYPLMNYSYQMAQGTNLQLLNNILKFIMVIFLVANYINETDKLKKINLGIILSIFTLIILHFIF